MEKAGNGAMNTLSEKALDRELEQALRTNQEFAAWFLGRTRFAGRSASYAWSRSDHPWTKCELEIHNAQTGMPETVAREGETDILAVFETPAGKRLALHIENKRETGQFTPYQPQGYAARAQKWVGNAAYGNYQEWEAILVAPKVVAQRFPRETEVFGAFVAYEDIAAFVPAFGAI